MYFAPSYRGLWPPFSPALGHRGPTRLPQRKNLGITDMDRRLASDHAHEILHHRGIKRPCPLNGVTDDMRREDGVRQFAERAVGGQGLGGKGIERGPRRAGFRARLA